MSTATLHSEKKKTLVPQLRFQEFEGKWIEDELGNITNWASGGTPPKDNPLFWDGDIPWISASSMRGIVYSDSELKITNAGLKKGSKLAKKGSLLILVRGSMLFNKIPIGIVSKDVSFNQDVKSIVVDSNYSTSEFILNWFTAFEPKILNMVTGTGIGAGKLDLPDLKALKISFPSLPEQQKIASFFSAVDEKIQQLSRKMELLEQYKKGVMKQLFLGKLRFKDENGKDYPDWEEKKLGEISNRVTRKNKENNLNVLTISAQLGLVSQLEYFNKSVSAKDVTNYYLLERNEFAYNKSYSKGYPMGAIKRLNKYDKGVVSTLYICFCFNENVSLNFMEHYFEFGLHNKEIEKVAQEGARNHGLLNIGVNDFLNIELIIPSVEEQQKIANFLSSIDAKIENVNEELEKTQGFKKGLLQQMFV